MSSFKKLIDSAKNQPAEPIEEEAIEKAPEASLKKKPSTKSSPKKLVQNITKERASRKHPEGGKSKNPAYRQTSIYVRKDLHRAVTRLLEDEEYEGDFSDWIEDCMLMEILKRQEA